MKIHLFDNKQDAAEFITNNYEVFSCASWVDEVIDSYEEGWYVNKSYYGDWTDCPSRMGVYKYDVEDGIDGVVSCLPQDECTIKITTI